MPDTGAFEVPDAVTLRIGRRIPTDAVPAEVIQDYAEEVGLRITHYCNITEIPAALYPTWASMVTDALRADPVYTETLGGLETTVVKLGDTSVEQRPAAVKAVNAAILDGITRNYAHDLHRYRRVPT